MRWARSRANTASPMSTESNRRPSSRRRSDDGDGMTLDTSSRLPLRGQRVVVVGGTSGMGLGAVRAAADAGAEVIAAGRRPKAVREVIQSGEGQVKHAVVDVTDEATVRALFDEIGALDHLFVTA